MKAILNNLRMSPRKVRLVADAVKGKTASEALAILSLLPKTATLPLLKLLRSAMANAKQNGGVTHPEVLRVSGLSVNSGATLKRSMPRARGTAYQILKRTSKIVLTLSESAQ